MGSESEHTPVDSDVYYEEYLVDDSSAKKNQFSKNITISSPYCSDSIENHESESLELRVGILEEPFVVLKETSETNKQAEKHTLCALLIDETKLNQKYEKHKGKIFGYTEGMGKKPLNEPKKMASKAVVFMVISLTDDWKIPIGLFFVHNPDIKYFADTIEETLKRLDEININIISVTLNCVSPHLSFALAEELGAEIDFINSGPTKNLKPCFAHPVHGEMVYIIYDFDIILGSLKNYWAIERNLVHGKKLEYYLISEVKKLEEKDMQSYGMDTVYDWVIIRKRLSYEPESISKTTADAMQYLKDLGHPDFQDSGPTIKFIRVWDLMAQLSNASGQEGLLFQCLSETDENKWKPLVVKLLSYIKHLKTLDKETPKHLSVFRVYIIGLIVSFTSLLQMYEAHVKPKRPDSHSTEVTRSLISLLPYRLGLKNIRLGLFDDWKSGNMTALFMFNKMKSLIENRHPIDVS